MGSILSGTNFADIRHRLWAPSLFVCPAITSVVVVLLSRVCVRDVCFGTVVFLETVCKKATEIRRWNDNLIHVLGKWWISGEIIESGKLRVPSDYLLFTVIHFT